MDYEMNNSSVFAKEEKLSMSKLAKILIESKSAAFTVCFTSKVDEKFVKERLENCTQKEFSDAKALARDLLVGKEVTLIARLSKAESKLGRSLVVDL